MRLSNRKPGPQRCVDHRSRRVDTISGARDVDRRALVDGKYFYSVPATINHKSGDVERVSDEAPPMLKSDRMREQKRELRKNMLEAKNARMMSKAEMLRALKERKADPEGTSRSLSKGKRKGAEERGEKRKKRQHEQGTHESGREPIPKEAIKKTSTSGGKVFEQTTEASCEYLDASTISFIAKPSGSASLDFTRRLIPDRDYNLVNSVPDLAALEAASLHLMQAVVWSGSVANRLLRAREEITKTKHSMDGVIQEHEGLMKQLEEIQATHDKENEEMTLELESSRARAFRVEEENKALQAEVAKWKDEAANSWELGKEKFLQSKEFRVLCSGKALAFFEKGFEGCLAQFRESGYTEEEHPASFLDVERALANLPDDEEEEGSSSGQEEAPPA
ncbi:hypothetical protein F511_11690 [Dorcoceras hygrometricum]|uniref:Uncharacterized protein n=1 Tax=Dorcoceras hygrometricum TaxID=472368 RepID=A0A2Z7C590_9LAMI|nr:hypothetical protein F511_11690 [Dorcoceras hygrometricum]